LSEKRCKNRRKALQQRSLTHQRIIFLCVEWLWREWWKRFVNHKRIIFLFCRMIMKRIMKGFYNPAKNVVSFFAEWSWREWWKCFVNRRKRFINRRKSVVRIVGKALQQRSITHQRIVFLFLQNDHGERYERVVYIVESVLYTTKEYCFFFYSMIMKRVMKVFCNLAKNVVSFFQNDRKESDESVL
jgi:hypothetical protein